MCPRPKKKRGAPIGNQNARKHGFYSKILTPEQNRLLSCASIPGLDAEIALLRMQIRSLIQDNPMNIAPVQRTMAKLCRLVRLKYELAPRRRQLLLSSVVEGNKSNLKLPI
jgi:hypothetical protein